LEKAFDWYQSEVTEKNLEKAAYCHQKVAKEEYVEMQVSLVRLYEDGEKTEKNLEKTFYWYKGRRKMATSKHKTILQSCIIMVNEQKRI
jgi:TPR repeat protein